MSEPQHQDILIRLMHFCVSPDMFVREEISGGYVRDMLRDARDEIDRLRAEVKELRQHRCLWGNDPSGPYVPDEYIHGVPHAAATACDVTRANDATGHQ